MWPNGRIDDTFSEVDADLLKLSQPSSNNEKLYIFRYPKNVNIQSIIDTAFLKELASSSSSRGGTSIRIADEKTYSIKADLDHALCTSFRPLMKDSRAYIKIGPPFDQSFHITETVVPSHHTQSSTNELRASLHQYVSLGYTNVEQIQDLEVRMLPRGSLTTMQDLQERKIESAKMYTKMMKKISKESSSSKVASLPTGGPREVGGGVDEPDIQTSSGRVDSTSSRKLKRKHSSEVEGGGDSDPSKGHHKKKEKREDNR